MNGMLRIAAILMFLLLLAGGALAGALIDADLPYADFIVLGLGLGQVLLLAAALVFARRWLLLRLAALASAICFWTALTPIHFPETALFIGCIYLSVALFAAGWCGLLHLGGVRLVETTEHLPESFAPRLHVERRGQFSLGTVLLVMSILGVYSGMLRAAQLDLHSLLVLLGVLALCLPGCLLMTFSGVSSPMRVRSLATMGLFLIALFLAWEFESDKWLAPAMVSVVLVELLFIGIAIGALSAAGVRLARPGVARGSLDPAPTMTEALSGEREASTP